jgi:ssDNA-binding Zn-finger/Zn-ribbon topoisomerase 1
MNQAPIRLIPASSLCPRCGCPMRRIMARVVGRIVTYHECPECDFITEPRRQEETAPTS